MNRAKRRENKARLVKMEKSINKLSDRQLIAMKQYTEQEIERVFSFYKTIVDKQVIKAMRENYISEERANRVIALAGVYIEKEVNKKEVG